MIEFTISADSAGQRLDKALRRLLPEVPLSHLYKLLRTRRVRVNGARAWGETILAEGDRVVVRGDRTALLVARPIAPRPPPLDDFRAAILYEDEHLLAFDKPAGLAVHPGSGLVGATLVDLARAYLPPAAAGEFAPSPAHRLDRDTSGIVLVAKTRRGMVGLAHAFEEGAVEKRYLALVKGRLVPATGSIELPLAEHQQTRRSREALGVRFQPAVTRYRTLAAVPLASLLTCRIETGRTHQIRRHLAASGHPVAGDRRYGDFPFNRQLKAETGLARMFLHAAALRLSHPMTGRPLAFASPLPGALAAVLERLGLASSAGELHREHEKEREADRPEEDDRVTAEVVSETRLRLGQGGPRLGRNRGSRIRHAR